MPTVQQLIGQLPPYQDQWQTIHPNQTVKDIMAEVLQAHNEFAPYYDNIALYFDDSDTALVCDNIFSFLKKNIKYQEETEDEQTTALPAGILTRQHGDCKHYAGFSAGILDALNRSGKNIKWYYVFASYKIFDDTPHHVFIEVEDHGRKIWIDPTPGADAKEPSWIVRKKIKADMSLKRNIAGVLIDNETEQLFINNNGTIAGRPHWQLMPVEGARGADGQHGTNPYFTGPFLALQHYLEDPYSVEGTDWNKTADAINAAIQTGPDTQHSVNGDFVKWIYEKSMKGWNFYYAMGVPDGYEPAVPLPDWYPKLILSDAGKLQFDKYYPVDDYMNNEIHAITAWAQDKINNGGHEVFPITPRAVKEYSQGKTTDNLFNEDRGISALKRIWKGFAFWNLYSMRGSYLNLVRTNWFHLGKKLWIALHNPDGSIDPEGFQKLYDVWGGVFGGKMEHLITASENGRYKPAIDTDGNTIGYSAVVIAAWAAAAAAVIGALGTAIASIMRAKGEKDGVDYNINPATGQPYPPMPVPLPVTGGGGFDPGGIITKIKANPLPYAAAGVGLYFLLNKKKKVTGIGDDILPLALLGFAAWYFFIRPQQQTGLTIDEMRQALFAVKDKAAEWIEYITNLSEDEVRAVYEKYFPVKLIAA